MGEQGYHTATVSRLSSGIEGLDTLLFGGFLKGGTYLIMGPPGAGKTICGNQISFHHVTTGGRAVYVTLLAESHARMLLHLQSMHFFRPEFIADTLYYVSGYSVLEQDGLKGLMNLLREVTRHHKATVLIIDGLIVAEEVAPSPLELKQFLHELHIFMEAIGCTTFLLTQFDGSSHTRPEFIMVDGLIELNDRIVDMRAVREIQIYKFRGSQSLRGRHPFEITEAGVVVHPRTEAVLTAQLAEVPTVSSQTEASSHREAFGVARLDEMLEGGVTPSSTTLVLGAPGTGKTVLGLHFLNTGAQNGQRGLFLGFQETPAQLIHKASRLGLAIDESLASGHLEILWQPQIEDILDVLAERLLAAIERGKVRRLFIDGLYGFQRTIASSERLALFLTALTTILRAHDVTTLCAVELPELLGSTVAVPIPGVTPIADNILFLRYVELRSQLYRLLSIMKVRDSAYDSSIREFRITDHGIEVADTFLSAESILTGQAHPAADAFGEQSEDGGHLQGQQP